MAKAMKSTVAPKRSVASKPIKTQIKGKGTSGKSAGSKASGMRAAAKKANC